MERTRLREPAPSQYKEARPVDPVFLAPAANGTPPKSKHPIAEHPQTLEVPRYRVVVEVALDDRLEPLSGLGHGIVHALAELLLNLSQLGSHAPCAPFLAPDVHPEIECVAQVNIREQR